MKAPTGQRCRGRLSFAPFFSAKERGHAALAEGWSVLDSGCPNPQGFALSMQMPHSAILLNDLWFVSILEKK